MTVNFYYLLIELVHAQIECIASGTMCVRASYWDALRQWNIKELVLLVVFIQLFGKVVNLIFLLSFCSRNFGLLICDRVILG